METIAQKRGQASRAIARTANAPHNLPSVPQPAAVVVIDGPRFATILSIFVDNGYEQVLNILAIAAS